MSKKQTKPSWVLKKIFHNKTKVLYALLCLIIGFGFYLRITGVITNSFAFTYDVGRDLLQVQSIFETHKIPLIGQTTGLGGLYYGPWWYYILTPGFFISGGNPQGVALYMVLIGVICIVLGYLLGHELGSKKLGLIIASLISTSGVMVGFSNQIWNPNIAPTLVMIVLLLTFFLKKTSKKSFFLYAILGFCLGLILDAEIVFGVLFIASAILFYLYLFRTRLFKLETIGAFLGFLVSLSPRLFFELRHNFVMTKSLFQMHGGDQKIFDPQNFFPMLPDRILTLLGQIKETFGFESQVGFYVFLCLFVGLGIILMKKMRKSEKELLVSIFIIFLVFLLGSAFFARAIWGHYLVGLPVLYIIAASIILSAVVRKNLLVGALVFFVLLYINVKPVQLISNFSKPLWEGNAAVYRNQLTAIDYIYKDSAGKNFNFVAYTPAVHDYTYRYLFSWYGKNTYGYTPSQKKENLFYLIIEPDPGYEGRIIDWLKVREGDGKIISRYAAKGGITVQKRIH